MRPAADLVNLRGSCSDWSMRQQVGGLTRRRSQARLDDSDRAFWVAMRSAWDAVSRDGLLDQVVWGVERVSPSVLRGTIKDCGSRRPAHPASRAAAAVEAPHLRRPWGVGPNGRRYMERGVHRLPENTPIRPLPIPWRRECWWRPQINFEKMAPLVVVAFHHWIAAGSMARGKTP